MVGFPLVVFDFGFILLCGTFQVTTWDWTRAEKSFTVYEIMCKILKVRQPLGCHSLSIWRMLETLRENNILSSSARI